MDSISAVANYSAAEKLHLAASEFIVKLVLAPGWQ